MILDLLRRGISGLRCVKSRTNSVAERYLILWIRRYKIDGLGMAELLVRARWNSQFPVNLVEVPFQ